MTNPGSIGCGNIADGTSTLIPSSSSGEACSPRRQLSWSDFGSLERQMAQRIETLEQHIETLERQLPSIGSGEKIGFLGGRDDGGAVGNVVHEGENKYCGTVASLDGEGSTQAPQCESKFPSNERGRRLRRRVSSQNAAKAVANSLSMVESEMSPKENMFELPESTFTMLTTEDIMSQGFVTGIIAASISMTCLVLALMNELDNSKPGNPLGVPWAVRIEVRVAQYLAILIGVLMEHEIPQGLEIIGKGVEQSLSGGTRFSTRRILLPSLLRLCLGYMFILTLFVAVVQATSVLGMFFDVLALEFVENIDDVIFGLSKRGFFGRSLRAATRSHFIETSRETHRLRRWTKRCIRFFYVFNICVSLGALSYLTVRQKQGAYRCKSFTVSFGDELWEDAYVGDVLEKRLLVYSHFNGIYEEVDDLHHGRPRYVERNKVDGAPFKHEHGIIPAEIVYCQVIESWVFRHDDIRTSNTEDENDCKWLLRSPSTDSFQLIELAEEHEWYLWTGHVNSEFRISIECNDCEEGMGESCNYHGKCGDKRCDCHEGFVGNHCQFPQPCDVIRSEKDETTTLKILGNPSDFVAVYGRPVFEIINISGKPTSLLRLAHPDIEAGTDGVRDDYFSDDFFRYNNRSTGFQELLKNYTFVLFYSGMRWYGNMLPPGLLQGTKWYDDDYHAFWDNAFSRLGVEDNSTFLISAPTNGLTPVGVDFYEMRRRNVPLKYNYDYGPFGVLIPLVEYEGSGFFHCESRNPLL